jgi:hypothetical protein
MWHFITNLEPSIVVAVFIVCLVAAGVSFIIRNATPEAPRQQRKPRRREKQYLPGTSIPYPVPSYEAFDAQRRATRPWCDRENE